MKTLVFLGAILGMHAFLSTANAQDFTPSHSFEVIENFKAELERFHYYNETKAEADKEAPELTKRMPRHVFQNGRLVYGKLQDLRYINGLEKKDVPALPSYEVRPKEVRDIADMMLRDVKALRALFGVEVTAEPAVFVDGKTPNDVYAIFNDTKALLNGFAIPKIVPNDVYRSALELLEGVEAIYVSRGGDPLDIEFKSKGIKPAQVFASAYDILMKLQELTRQRADMKIPGGVVLPNQRTGQISPEHVIMVINDAIAEVHALSVHLNAFESNSLIPEQSGKTPADSYDVLVTVKATLDRF